MLHVSTVANIRVKWLHVRKKHTTVHATSAPQSLRPLCWVGSSKKVLKAMPEDVQDVFGFGLHELQCGEAPEGARPFGEGLDTRIHKMSYNAANTNTYRMAYVAVFTEVVYVLDVFEKKARKGKTTPKPDKQRVSAAFRTARSHYMSCFGGRT